MSQVSHDLSRPLATSSDHLRRFPIIFSNFRWFLPSADVSRALQTPIGYHVTLQKFLQFGKTVAEDTSMSVYQNSEAVLAYHFSPTSARWFGTPFSPNIRWLCRLYDDIISFKTSQRTSAGLYIVYVVYGSAERYSIHVHNMSDE